MNPAFISLPPSTNKRTHLDLSFTAIIFSHKCGCCLTAEKLTYYWNHMANKMGDFRLKKTRLKWTFCYKACRASLHIYQVVLLSLVNNPSSRHKRDWMLKVTKHTKLQAIVLKTKGIVLKNGSFAPVAETEKGVQHLIRTNRQISGRPRWASDKYWH